MDSHCMPSVLSVSRIRFVNISKSCNTKKIYQQRKQNMVNEMGGLETGRANARERERMREIERERESKKERVRKSERKRK